MQNNQLPQFYLSFPKAGQSLWCPKPRNWVKSDWITFFKNKNRKFTIIARHLQTELSLKYCWENNKCFSGLGRDFIVDFLFFGSGSDKITFLWLQTSLQRADNRYILIVLFNKYFSWLEKIYLPRSVLFSCFLLCFFLLFLHIIFHPHYQN